MKWRAGIVLAIVAAIAFSLLERTPDPLWNGRRISAWTHDLLSTDPEISLRAADVLEKIGSPAAPHLGKLLREREPKIPAQFVAAARKIRLLRAAEMSAEAIQARVFSVLDSLGPAAEQALPDILPLLEHPSGQDVPHLLRRIGPAAGTALTRSLKTGPEIRRVRAAYELRDFGVERQASLIAALSDKSENVRATAAESLGVLHASARDALLACLNDPAERVRANASEALGLIGDQSVISQLQARLHDSAASVRLHSAKSIWKLAQDESAILPTLVQLLATEESWQAAYLLAQMHEKAAPAIPALIEAMRREQVPRPFRAPPSVTFALGKIGAPAVPELIKALADTNPLYRVNAAMALGIMENAASNAVPSLLLASVDRETEVREAAALALGAIGSKDEKAITALSQCLHAEDIFVRSTAMELLRKLAPNREWAGSTD